MQRIRNLPAADIVAVLYLLGAAAVFSLSWDSGFEYRNAVLLNILFVIALIFTSPMGRPSTVTTRRSFRTPFGKPFRVLRGFYPLLLIGLIYVQTGFFIRLLYGPTFTFDAMVAAWDLAVFGVNPNRWMYTALPGRFWAETMHLLYVLFYPLLAGGFLFVIFRRPEDYPRFAFIFICSFLCFVAMFVGFPVSGPMEHRVGLFPDTVLFSNLVDRLYTFGIPASGGAFPSAHVGQSVILLLALWPIGKGTAILVIGIILGIAVSMVHATVHYAVDAVAGVPAGILLYSLWNRVYARGIARAGLSRQTVY